MKRILHLKITALLCATCGATSLPCFAAAVSFDNYSSASNNDYVNGFNEGQYCAPGYYVQQTTGGITGGALRASNIGNYGNDTSIYKTVFGNSPGTTNVASMSFKFNSSLVNAVQFNTALELAISPDDGNHQFRSSIRGTGTDLGLYIYAYSGSARGTIPLLSNNVWYNLRLAVTNIGGALDQVNVEASFFNLGVTGQSAPSLIGTAALTVFDTAFATDVSVETHIYSERRSGADVLDNFSAGSVPEPTTSGLILFGGTLLWRRKRKKSGV